jgi:hypothetical protein
MCGIRHTLVENIAVVVEVVGASDFVGGGSAPRAFLVQDRLNSDQTPIHSREREIDYAVGSAEWPAAQWAGVVLIRQSARRLVRMAGGR